MTERARVWFPHDRDLGLLAVQIVLVLSGVSLALGRQVWASGMIAAVARAVEAFVFFSLNDFFFVSVVYLLLAHSDGGPFARGAARGGRHPRWVRDALILQLGWIYVATGVLKLNPDWLDGGQIFVRTQYLATSHGWPYPEALSRAFSSLAFDAKLSMVGAASEIALGGLMFARGPYWLAAWARPRDPHVRRRGHECLVLPGIDGSGSPLAPAANPPGSLAFVRARGPRERRRRSLRRLSPILCCALRRATTYLWTRRHESWSVPQWSRTLW